MEPISISAGVTGVIGAVDMFYNVVAAIKPSDQDVGHHRNMILRVQHVRTFLHEVAIGWQSNPTPNIDLQTVHAQLEAVMDGLISRDHKSPFSIGSWKSKRPYTLKNVEIMLNDLETMMGRLHQITLQRQVTQLESTTQSMHMILLAVAEFFEHPVEVTTGQPGTEGNHNIEAMRTRLHEALAANPSSRQPRNDPFCFAFVVLPVTPDGAVEPARGQVKIDTGAEDNWISTRLLEMASVPFTPDASLGTFRGANGQPFKPLGRVSVTWYSENQARTQTSDFLIHDSAPFDAILGSGWVLEECLNVFHKPVLPLFRMTMGPDEFNDLKKRQEATNASNDEVIALQRIEKRARRARERQEEAQSRALSRITSPATLTRKNSSESLSTFPSFATSKSTVGSSTPGNPAQGSSTTEVPGVDSKGKQKEGSDTATVP